MKRSLPPAGMACSAFSTMLVSARLISSGSIARGRQVRWESSTSNDDALAETGAVRTETSRSSSRPMSVGDGRRRRGRGEARELRRDLPEQPHLRQDGRDALLETGPSGSPRSACTRRRCSALSWIGVSGFLMSCATWRAISAHASSRWVRSSSARCRCRSAAIRLKSSTSRRSSSDEVAATRASRSPRAIRRVARVSRFTGSAMRSAIE